MLSDSDLRKAKQRFKEQQGQAARRKDKNGAPIEWCLTFEQWIAWWLATGHYHERGRKRGQYVMSRKGDIGPYSIDNIECVLTSTNLSRANAGRPMPEAQRARLSELNRSRSYTPEQLAKRTASNRANKAARLAADPEGESLKKAALKAKLSALGREREAARRAKGISEETREKLRAAARRKHELYHNKQTPS